MIGSLHCRGRGRALTQLSGSSVLTDKPHGWWLIPGLSVLELILCSAEGVLVSGGGMIDICKLAFIHFLSPLNKLFVGFFCCRFVLLRVLKDTK